jgi:hypothetical protein
MILAKQYQPSVQTVSYVTNTTAWTRIWPLELDFVAPGPVLGSLQTGIDTKGQLWLGMMDLISGFVFGEVLLCDEGPKRKGYKGLTAYDLVPLDLEAGRAYALAMAVRPKYATQIVTLKTGKNHPAAVLEVMA